MRCARACMARLDAFGRRAMWWSRSFKRDVVVSKGGAIQTLQRRSALSWEILPLIQSTCDDWRIGPGRPKQFERSLGTRFYREQLVLQGCFHRCAYHTIEELAFDEPGHFMPEVFWAFHPSLG